MTELLGRYRNGNYVTFIYSDGTRIRYIDTDYFHPDFAECIDVQISHRCNRGCDWCYANCTPDGDIVHLKDYRELWDSCHPYTELAINLNFPLCDDFEWFLKYMHDRHVIINVTINAVDLIEHTEKVKSWINDEYIYGLGVSYVPQLGDQFWKIVAGIDNAVVHLVNGLFSSEDIYWLSKNNLKILILGYKNIGRGIDYFRGNNHEVEGNILWTKEHLNDLFNLFELVAFDNLALEQLNVKNYLTDEQWREFYSGDEGEFTYYIDLPNGTYAVNSMSNPLGEITQNVDDMFPSVRGFIKGTKILDKNGNMITTIYPKEYKDD